MKKQRKVLVICIVLLCIMLFIIHTLKSFDEEISGGVKELIGEEFGGVSSLSIRENTILRNAVEIYLNSISEGDFDKAYGYISSQYKEIVSKEVFMTKMTEIGLENFKEIKDNSIVQVTTNMFVSKITLENGMKQEILIILDDEDYYIVPEPFLEYNVIDNKITRDKITYHLNGYEIDLEKCIFDFTITNNSNDEIKIIDAQMGFETGGYKRAVNNEFSVPANETLNVAIQVETYLDFPTSFKLTRQDGEKQRIYTFEL